MVKKFLIDLNRESARIKYLYGLTIKPSELYNFLLKQETKFIYKYSEKNISLFPAEGSKVAKIIRNNGDSIRAKILIPDNYLPNNLFCVWDYTKNILSLRGFFLYM